MWYVIAGRPVFTLRLGAYQLVAQPLPAPVDLVELVLVSTRHCPARVYACRRNSNAPKCPPLKMTALLPWLTLYCCSAGCSPTSGRVWSAGDWRVSSLLADDATLRKTSPGIVTYHQFDTLRDEGAAYVQRLKAVGRLQDAKELPYPHGSGVGMGEIMECVAVMVERRIEGLLD